jgi:hypothetical protein
MNSWNRQLKVQRTVNSKCPPILGDSDSYRKIGGGVKLNPKLNNENVVKE